MALHVAISCPWCNTLDEYVRVEGRDAAWCNLVEEKTKGEISSMMIGGAGAGFYLCRGCLHNHGINLEETTDMSTERTTGTR